MRDERGGHVYFADFSAPGGDGEDVLLWGFNIGGGCGDIEGGGAGFAGECAFAMR